MDFVLFEPTFSEARQFIFKIRSNFSKNEHNLGNSAPTVPQVEPLFKSILEVYDKLKALGFTYYKGKVTEIEIEEENQND